MSDYKDFEAIVKMPDGSYQTVVERAKNHNDAKKLFEAKYGQGNLSNFKELS